MEIGTLPEQVNTEELDDDSFLERIWNAITNREVLGAGYEIGAGLTFDAATAGFSIAPPLYAALNFGEGYISNIIAQKIRGQKWNEIDWNEAMSSGALGVIPLSQLRAAKYLKKPAAETVEKVAGKAGTLQRNIVSGGITGGGDVTIRSGLEGELPDPAELATGVVGGGALAGTLTPILKRTSKYVNEIVANKKANTAESELLSKQLEIQEKIKNDPNSITPEDTTALRKAIWNVDKAKGDYGPFDSFEEFEQISRRMLGSIEDKIDDPDFEVGFTKTDTLSDRQFKQYESFMEAYAYRQSQNDLVRAKAEELESKGANVPSDVKRKIAGFINLNELEGIAKRNRRPRTDVWKYLLEQARKEKELVDAIREINEIEGYANYAKIEQFIKNHENEITKKTLQYLRTLQRNVQYPFKRYWNKGHKRSLLELYLADITGGNVASNMIIERQGNLDIQLPDGTTFLERGNLGTGAREDVNLYTLVKLQNATWDLEDDFRKTIMPDLYPGEGINKEYEDIAQRLYKIHMDRAADNLGIKPEFRNLPPNKRDLEYYSRVLTDALHAYFKKAEEFNIPETEIQYREIFEIEDSPYEKQFREMEDIFLKILGQGQRNKRDIVGPFSTKTDDLTQPDRPPGTPKSG